MQSVFYPDERINIRYSIYVHPEFCCVDLCPVYKVMLLLNRYDIKGCEVGRWTNPDTGGKQMIKVLKDNNFEGQYIALGECPHPSTYSTCFHSHINCKGTLNGNVCVVAAGQDKPWFADQLKVDAAFLQELNVLDYSLLLAHQPLHQDERDGKHCLADLVVRATK